MSDALPPSSPSRAGRKGFKRTKISLVERIISVSIVVLLAGIGIAIWIKGRNFDPGLYSLRSGALKSTESTVPEKSSPRVGNPKVVATDTDADAGGEEAAEPAGTTAPAAIPEEGHGEAPQASAKTVSAAPKPGQLEIPGTKPMGETEVYSPDTLYEKIDGRAPAYLEFHFQQLRSRSFSLPDSAGSYVDVYEYRMDSPVNAFGIFALERDPAGKPLDFAPDGYSGEMGFFFRQGNCYVQVIASDRKPGTLTLARSVAGQISKQIPVDDAGLDARRMLPVQGIVPESVTFVEDNAQGQDFLKNVFQAEYNFEGKKVAFFLMTTTPEAAAKAWASYLAFSGRYGGKAETLPDIGEAKVFQALNFGKWKFIYQRGGELGGIIDAQDPVAARAFLDKVLDGTLR